MDLCLVPVPFLLPVATEYTHLPMLEKTCTYNFGGVEVFVTVLKKHRQLKLKVKEVGAGVTVKVEVTRKGEVAESVQITEQKKTCVVLNLQKDDSVSFKYLYPRELLPPPKVDFKACLVEKHC